MEKIMTKENEKEFRNTVGFFRDPWTGEELTKDMKRVPGCKPYRPCVYDSQGNSIPINYPLWTAEERKAYQEMRKNGVGGSTSKKDTELRTNLLGLQEFLSKALKGDDLKKVNDMIAKIMPADPEVARKEAKIAKLKAMLAELEG